MNKCCKSVTPNYSYRSHICNKPAKVEVDGFSYCGIHDPNKQPTKSQIQADINWENKKAKWKLEAAAPNMIEALKEIVEGYKQAIEEAELLGIPFPADMLTAYNKARAAIAKATGAAS